MYPNSLPTVKDSAERAGGNQHPGPSLEALQCHQVDVLLIAAEYLPPPGWSCRACGGIDPDFQRPLVCGACGASDLQGVDLKEEMVRHAEQARSRVEVVAHSDLLMEFGGVGCLLRYRTPIR